MKTMQAHSVAPIISFCSNEIRFFKPCLQALGEIAEQTYVVVWDRFFDGTPENEEVLGDCFANFPKVRFLVAPFVPHLLPKKMKRKIGKDLWFNLSRMVGAHFARENYLLFLDADEILDADAFSKWLATKQYLDYEAIRLANFWYFRSFDSQAISWEDSAVFARNGSWIKEALLLPGDRHAIYNAAKTKARHQTSLQKIPMIHHYSWVRTKEEILKKMQLSAHKNEKNWKELIEEEWAKPWSDKDFVHGYDLKKVPPFISMDIEEKFSFKKAAQKELPNVHRISSEEFLKIIGIGSWKRVLLNLRALLAKKA